MTRIINLDEDLSPNIVDNTLPPGRAVSRKNQSSAQCYHHCDNHNDHNDHDDHNDHNDHNDHDGRDFLRFGNGERGPSICFYGQNFEYIGGKLPSVVVVLVVIMLYRLWLLL